MALKNCRECGREVSESAKVCPNCGIGNPVRSVGVGGFLIVALVGLVAFNVVSNLQEYGSAKKPADVIDPKVLAKKDVTLKKWSWEKGGFDNVLIVNGIIANNTGYAVKDPVLVCTIKASSGTELKTLTATLYEELGQFEEKRFKRLRVGLLPDQSGTAACRVADVTML